MAEAQTQPRRHAWQEKHKIGRRKVFGSEDEILKPSVTAEENIVKDLDVKTKGHST